MVLVSLIVLVLSQPLLRKIIVISTTYLITIEETIREGRFVRKLMIDPRNVNWCRTVDKPVHVQIGSRNIRIAGVGGRVETIQIYERRRVQTISWNYVS